jgi:hypothetical protein
MRKLLFICCSLRALLNGSIRLTCLRVITISFLTIITKHRLNKEKNTVTGDYVDDYDEIDFVLENEDKIFLFYVK